MDSATEREADDLMMEIVRQGVYYQGRPPEERILTGAPDKQKAFLLAACRALENDDLRVRYLEWMIEAGAEAVAHISIGYSEEPMSEVKSLAHLFTVRWDEIRRLLTDELATQGRNAFRSCIYPGNSLVIPADQPVTREHIYYLFRYRLYDESGRYMLVKAVEKLLARNLRLTPDEMDLVVQGSDLLAWPAVRERLKRYLDAGGELTATMQDRLNETLAAHTANPPFGAEASVLREQIEEMLGICPAGEPFPNEPWSDVVRADWVVLPEPLRDAWKALFIHAQSADGGKPGDKWLREAEAHRQAVGGDAAFLKDAVRWLSLVAYPSWAQLDQTMLDRLYSPAGLLQGVLSQRNMTILKGLVWYASFSDAPDAASAVAHVAAVAFMPYPGVGPWAVSVGNAALWTLGVMPAPNAPAELNSLLQKIAHRPAQTAIRKALQQAGGRPATAP